MSPARLNTAYAIFLIGISAVILFSQEFSLNEFQQYSALILAGFGLVLLPMSSPIKRAKPTAKYISMALTGFVGGVSLVMLLQSYIRSQQLETGLIAITIISFIVVGIYLNSNKTSTKA